MNTKINLSDISKEELEKMIKDVQYALDGKYDFINELHCDTGIPMDECQEVLDSINKFLSINC
jgi:hypothetical protein